MKLVNGRGKFVVTVLISAVIDIRRDTTATREAWRWVSYSYSYSDYPSNLVYGSSHCSDTRRIRRQQYLDMRRTHTKSRRGCSNCKRRHVKVTFPIFFLSNSATSLSPDADPVQGAMWIAISREPPIVHYQLHLIHHPEAKAVASLHRLGLYRRRGI